MMPSLDFIDYRPTTVFVENGCIYESPIFVDGKNGREELVIKGYPQLYWSDGRAWDIANLWAASFYRRIQTGDMDLQTLISKMYSERTYMQYLEDNDLEWTYFPLTQSERCLHRFCSHLNGARKRGVMTYRTAKTKMGNTIELYSWVDLNGLFSVDVDVSQYLPLSVRVENKTGLERSLAVKKTELRIRGTKGIGERVEDGLLPVNYMTQYLILELAEKFCSLEVYLMLLIGFNSGMRLGSICDIKLLTLKHARKSDDGSFYYLSLGPSVRYAPVATKFGMSGEVPIPAYIYDKLVGYSGESRRILRGGKASTENKKLLFLNRDGESYCRKGGNRSSSVNGEIRMLRQVALQRGVKLDFKFHQTRATFGTNFVMENLDKPGVRLVSVIGALRDLLLHKNEKSTMTYIKFVQNHKIKEGWANEYMRRTAELAKCR